jgi:hypothetical protein
MNVTLTSPISISLSTAKLVVEDGDLGTIEFKLFDQPVRLLVNKTDYTYDVTIAVGDRVKLIQAFSNFAIDSSGVVQKITPDYTEDKISVLFDSIIPDQVVQPVEAHIISTHATLLVELPLSYVEKV